MNQISILPTPMKGASPGHTTITTFSTHCSTNLNGTNRITIDCPELSPTNRKIPITNFITTFMHIFGMFFTNFTDLIFMRASRPFCT